MAQRGEAVPLLSSWGVASCPWMILCRLLSGASVVVEVEVLRSVWGRTCWQSLPQDARCRSLTLVLGCSPNPLPTPVLSAARSRRVCSGRRPFRTACLQATPIHAPPLLLYHPRITSAALHPTPQSPVCSVWHWHAPSPSPPPPPCISAVLMVLSRAHLQPVLHDTHRKEPSFLSHSPQSPHINREFIELQCHIH